MGNNSNNDEIKPGQKRYLTTSFKGYLKPEAELLHDELTEVGFDPDLATALLEATSDEKDLYELPEEDEG